jgi:hypothetical protein
MKYNPDNWVIMKFPHRVGSGYYYKVLAGWSGGYLDGDSWRINSGISKVEYKDKCFYFYGETGSCYICHEDGYGLRMNIISPHDQLIDYNSEISMIG